MLQNFLFHKIFHITYDLTSLLYEYIEKNGYYYKLTLPLENDK